MQARRAGVRSRAWVRPGARRAGLTLIEVLAAVAILAIGLVGTSSMVTYSVIAHDRAANYTLASERATQEIERIRDAGYNGAVVGPDLFPSPDYTILSATQVAFSFSTEDRPRLPSGRGVITLEMDPEALANNPNTGAPYSNLKRLTVQIWWRGHGGTEQTATYTTLLANRPK